MTTIAPAGYRWAGREARPLTTRQQECVAGLWHGRREREIAADLGLAPATVGQHLDEAARRRGIVGQGCTRTILALWLIGECQRATGIRLGQGTVGARGAGGDR